MDSPLAASQSKAIEKMRVLVELKKQFMIRQASGRMVPLNDLDCCLIAI